VLQVILVLLENLEFLGKLEAKESKDLVARLE
jgi:hypothetical protein